MSVWLLFTVCSSAVFFTCPLFCKFRDLGDFTKITGYEYSKSHSTFSVLLSLASKNAKIKGAKIF